MMPRSPRSLTEKLRVIYDDALVRRELLWLRAQEEHDLDSVAALEREDPALRSRMQPLLAERHPELMDDPGERRAEFARLWHRRMQEL